MLCVNLAVGNKDKISQWNYPFIFVSPGTSMHFHEIFFVKIEQYVQHVYVIQWKDELF